MEGKNTGGFAGEGNWNSSHESRNESDEDRSGTDTCEGASGIRHEGKTDSRDDKLIKSIKNIDIINTYTQKEALEKNKKKLIELDFDSKHVFYAMNKNTVKQLINICKKNKLEKLKLNPIIVTTDKMAKMLADNGFEKIKMSEQSDINVILKMIKDCYYEFERQCDSEY